MSGKPEVDFNLEEEHILLMSEWMAMLALDPEQNFEMLEARGMQVAVAATHLVAMQAGYFTEEDYHLCPRLFPMPPALVCDQCEADGRELPHPSIIFAATVLAALMTEDD